MLNGRFELHDIRDTEAFCARIIQRSKLELTPEDHEDLLTYLIEEAWILSTRYHHSRISFSTWAGTTLRKRIPDWQRQRNGRTTWKFRTHTHHRPRPILVELDDTHGGTQADPTDDRTPDLLRLLRA